MSNRYTRNRLGVSEAGIMAAWQDDRDDELLEAVVTAAALVARADGHLHPKELQILRLIRVASARRLGRRPHDPSLSQENRTTPRENAMLPTLPSRTRKAWTRSPSAARSSSR